MEEFPKLVNSSDNSTITINNSSFSIGRSLSCDHIVPLLGISRFHCIIKKSDDKWTLFDRSSNGTIVNDIHYKFNESVDLKNGDVIKLGPENLDFVFTLSEQSNEQVDNDETIPLQVAEEFEQPFEAEPPKPQTSQNLDIMENELTCSICAELFIKAVTLDCSHTFCKHCIAQWMKNKATCPICRKKIHSVAPTLVLDNFIEKIISTQNNEMKEARQSIVKQREEVADSSAGSSNSVATIQIIEICSEDEDGGEDTDDYSDQDFDDYEDDDSYGSSYYGGYGRCFICNQSGHWANGCPFKRQ